MSYIRIDPPFGTPKNHIIDLSLSVKHKPRLLMVLDAFADMADQGNQYNAEQDLEHIAVPCCGANRQCPLGLLAMLCVQGKRALPSKPRRSGRTLARTFLRQLSGMRWPAPNLSASFFCRTCCFLAAALVFPIFNDNLT